MAQLGPGHRISSQIATRENMRTATWKKIYINLAAYRHLSQLIGILPALHWLGIGYTRISNAATGAPLAALIAAAYIPACRR